MSRFKRLRNGNIKTNPGESGRGTRCTPELVEKLCHHIRQGNFVTTAAALVGIARPMFYQWLEKGRQDYQQCVMKADSPEFTRCEQCTPYCHLLHEVQRANAEGEAINVGRVNLGAARDPKWAAWLLEKRFKPRWGDEGRASDADKKKIADQSQGVSPAVVILPARAESMEDWSANVQKYLQNKDKAGADQPPPPEPAPAQPPAQGTFAPYIADPAQRERILAELDDFGLNDAM